MKKRILALLLAFSMMLSLLPVSALADTGGIDSAAYASNGLIGGTPDLVMTTGGIPDTSNAASRTEDNKMIWYGTGWTYDGDTLTLETGIYDFNNTKPTTKNGDVLKLVSCTVVVKNGGTMTNCLFKRSTPPEGVTNCHKLTEVNNSKFEVTLLNAPSFFIGRTTYYFTGTPKLVVKLATPGSFNELHHINGEEHYNDLTGPDSGYYTFTPIAGDDIVLNREDYVTNLVITADGIPVTTGREPIYQDDNSSNPIIGYKGDGWTYMLNSATNEKGVLTLMQRSNNTANYIFSENWNLSTAIECDVIVEGPVQIHNGVFHGAVTLKSANAFAVAVASESIFTGTVTLEGISNQISWSYFGKDARLVGFENGTIWHCVFAGDTSGYPFSTDTKYCLFASKPTGLTTYEVYTEDHKEFSATFYENDEYAHIKCPEKLTGQKMYVQQNPPLIVTRTDGLKIINGTALTETDWSGWYYPHDTILKRNYRLTVENGTLNDTTPAQGDFGSGTSITVQADAPTDTDTFFTGWTVTPADTELMNGNAPVDLTQSNITFDMPIVIAPDGLTLTATYAPYVTDLAIKNGFPDTEGRQPIYVTGCMGDGWTYDKDNMTLRLENRSYDFSTNGLGQLAPDVKLVVGPSVTLTGGVFNEKPDGLTTDNVQTIILNGSGSIEAVNGLSSPKWNTTLYAIKDSQVEIKADTDITNINGWDIGKFPGGSSYPNGEDDKTTVRFRMPDGPVVLNDTLYTLNIIRGTMLGNTSVSAPAGTELILDADEPAKNETFLGWTLSDESLLKDGTLNDPECKTITIKMKNAGATAEAKFQKDTPAYTLTVTGGGLVNGKTSAEVEAGKEVRLTVGEMQEGMSFNYWDLPTELTKALTDKELTDKDFTFSNKVEPLTFTMPDLSKYTEDTRFTIRLDIRPAELPDDDDGPSVLGTMATVAVGGAAAGILVWQGVSLGVDSYLQLSLPGGVPVPANRRELVKLLWETAGTPDVVLPALYGDVSTEDAELQKATRWAIDNGLVKPADETDASRFDPDRSVSKYEVARAWFKVKQMMK